MDVFDLTTRFFSYFWEVFCFWACWQVCDFILSRLKVKLRKPWKVEIDDRDLPSKS